jgi:hypothetical protein
MVLEPVGLLRDVRIEFAPQVWLRPALVVSR